MSYTAVARRSYYLYRSAALADDIVRQKPTLKVRPRETVTSASWGGRLLRVRWSGADREWKKTGTGTFSLELGEI